MKKGLIATFMVALMLITVLSGVVTVNAISISDDTTPPITWHILNPSEPNENGWYTTIEITIYAEDSESGVKEIKVLLCGGPWQIIPGDVATFFVYDCDGEDVLIEYTAVDNAGNQALIKTFEIDIDGTNPDIDLTYEFIERGLNGGWLIEFTAIATDSISGMDRVEFFENDVLQDTITGPGPTYIWSYEYPGNLIITIRATAFDKAGNNNFEQISTEFSRNSIPHSTNPLLIRLIERFPLLNQIFQRLRI